MRKEIVVCALLTVLVSGSTNAAYHFDAGDGTAKPKLAGVGLRRFNWLNTSNPDWDFIRVVDNYVINVRLQDVSKGPGDNDWTAIDTVLTFADRAKKKGIDLHFKLRFATGIFAPQWMKDKYGKFLLPGKMFEDAGWTEGADPNCVKWWDEGYLDAWAQFMSEVAARYDNNPYISEIVISGTAAGTAEPLSLAISNGGEGAERRDAYMQAGCTDEKMQQAIFRSIDAMKVFRQTNIGLALNTYIHLNRSTAPDNEVAKKIGEYVCKTFGSRAVLGNNGLRTGDAPGMHGKDWSPGGKMYELEMFYQEMHKKYGSGIYNQTASTKQMGGYEFWTASLDNGAALSSSFVELPETEKSIKSRLTMVQLQHYKEAYKKNE